MANTSALEAQSEAPAGNAVQTRLAPTELLVCISCRSASAPPDLAADARRPGDLLLTALQNSTLPEGVTLHPVECLSNCDRGCTVALRGGARWTYIYGNLDPGAHLDTLLDGVARYHGTLDGLVAWRDRPVHFRKNCIARIPPATPPQESQNV